MLQVVLERLVSFGLETRVFGFDLFTKSDYRADHVGVSPTLGKMNYHGTNGTAFYKCGSLARHCVFCNFRHFQWLKLNGKVVLAPSLVSIAELAIDEYAEQLEARLGLEAL